MIQVCFNFKADAFLYLIPFLQCLVVNVSDGKLSWTQSFIRKFPTFLLLPAIRPIFCLPMHYSKALKSFWESNSAQMLVFELRAVFFFGNVGFSFLLWTFTNLTPISFSTCTSFVQDSGVCYCCCQEFIAPCICSLLLHVFVLLKEKFMCNKQPG